MKQRNQYRSLYKREQSSSSKVKLLETAFSLKERFFSKVAWRRGWRKFRRWGIILLPVLLLIAGIVWACLVTLQNVHQLSIDNISFDSRQKIISKEQAMQILGIKDSINMTALNTTDLKEKLEANICIESADIRAELPDTLHIEINERIPVVYVEQESGADTGNRVRFFMDPSGFLFPVMPEYHQNFMALPVWYLQPGDVEKFEARTIVSEDKRRPIVELAAAANMYSLVEIPSIKEIYRPKDWKIIITLENGAEVLMQAYDIKEQMERLNMILEHCRATKRRARSINVIPRINPTVIYAE